MALLSCGLLLLLPFLLSRNLVEFTADKLAIRLAARYRPRMALSFIFGAPGLTEHVSEAKLTDSVSVGNLAVSATNLRPRLEDVIHGAEWTRRHYLTSKLGTHRQLFELAQVRLREDEVPLVRVVLFGSF